MEGIAKAKVTEVGGSQAEKVCVWLIRAICLWYSEIPRNWAKDEKVCHWL